MLSMRKRWMVVVVVAVLFFIFLVVDLWAERGGWILRKNFSKRLFAFP